MSLTIGVPREIFAGEKRVAAVPEVVEKLIKLGFAVCVETKAGAAANFGDDAYQAAGAGSRAVPRAHGQLRHHLQGACPDSEEIALMKPGSTLVSFIWPAQNRSSCSN